MQRALQRITLALLALLAALALAELTLRAGGWLMLQTSGRQPRPSAGGPLWSCLGDSNVYGLFVGPEQAYPAQLQKLLGDRRAVVRNDGVPGNDTRAVLARLPAVLAAGPDVVLLTAGANNAWSWAGSDPEPRPTPWYQELRVVRVVRWLSAADAVDNPGAPAAAQNPGGEPPGAIDLARQTDSVRRDIGRIAEQVQRAGARLVLVGYAADASIYAGGNAGMRLAAEHLGLPWVETSVAATELARRIGFEAAFYPDLHPRAPTYQLVARLVYNALVDLGTVDASAIADPLRGLGAGAGQRHVRAHPAPPGHLALELDGGEPGRPFTILMWGAHREAGAGFGATDLERDPVHTATREAPELHGQFDSHGRAQIRAPLPAGLRAELERAGTRVWVACLRHAHDQRPRPELLGDPIEVDLPPPPR